MKKEPKYTKQWLKKNQMFKSFFEYMIDHAIQCDIQRCICKASTFNDLCADLRNIDESYERDVNELFTINTKRYLEKRNTDYSS